MSGADSPGGRTSQYLTKTGGMPKQRSSDADPVSSLSVELQNWRFTWFHCSSPYRKKKPGVQSLAQMMAVDLGLSLWQTVVPRKMITRRKYMDQNKALRWMDKNQKLQSRLEPAAG